MSSDEPIFLAYRYLAGELSPPECAAFEDRLAADQASREALAQATQLAESVHLACEAGAAALDAVGATRDDHRAPATPLGRRWLERAGWMATGAAAVALTYFAIRQQGALPERSDPAAEALVSAWVQQPPVIAFEPADEEWSGEPSDDEAAVASGEEPEFVHIPGWMLAAVSAAQGPAEGAQENIPLSPERID
jgi:hypothetical protein